MAAKRKYKYVPAAKHPLTKGDKRNAYPEGYYLHSYREISAEIGLSVEGVRQLEIRALKKLRKALEDEGLTFQDLLQLGE